MKEKQKLRLNVIKVKSFVTALDREEIDRIDAGAGTTDCDSPGGGNSSDRVWACAETDYPCDTYNTCAAGGCGMETTPGDGCGGGTLPV